MTPNETKQVETVLEPVRVKIHFQRMQIETPEGAFKVVPNWTQGQGTADAYAIFADGKLEIFGKVDFHKPDN
jgi:hypothetical protein